MHSLAPQAQNPDGQFGSTHWSVVLAAAQTRSPDAEEALERLCLAYYYPLYVYARRRGLDAEQAQDITQSFFAERVVTKLIFRGVSPGAGKFRTWLLNSFLNFLRNDWERQKAQKRGGGAVCLSLDFTDAEGRYTIELKDLMTPEILYDRAWAITLTERAVEHLRRRYERRGQAEWFGALAANLPGTTDPEPYKETAARFGKTEAAVKMAVSRLRREYGEVLREEIKRTLSEKGDPEEELRHLKEILSG
jgi:RNA polymerase sigma-70 factor (ECF subfamily)